MPIARPSSRTRLSRTHADAERRVDRVVAPPCCRITVSPYVPSCPTLTTVPGATAFTVAPSARRCRCRSSAWSCCSGSRRGRSGRAACRPPASRAGPRRLVRSVLAAPAARWDALAARRRSASMLAITLPSRASDSRIVGEPRLDLLRGALRLLQVRRARSCVSCASRSSSRCFSLRFSLTASRSFTSSRALSADVVAQLLHALARARGRARRSRAGTCSAR